ncbi:hypothetical protein HFO41_25075 [Rhizobium leguminosarum]|uniref:hypothetical protein n=1 Tax=Rhizobium leguminosarum TaxID=384 RepID=UPI001C94F41B|nr:hypothetical protein [Rhizobium leguminosarum]MBY5692059.1 hypothetical protein [Rhizobium leguminosarum]
MSLKATYENVPSEAEHYFDQHRWEWQDRFLRGSTALYDPIFTPLFTSLFTALNFSAATASLLGAGAAAIATTALAIGIQALLAPKPPKPEDGKIPKVQSIPYRQWGVGRNRVAGAFMLWEAVGKKLYSVQAIAGHKIKSINRYWLHDDEVTLQSNGVINTGTNYKTNVQIFSRLGDVPEGPYTSITADLAAGGIWTNDHRGDGQASLGMICTSSTAELQQKRFPYGPPQLSVEADLALCWDFRDPDQDPDDPDTWEWTRNAALIMAWHQCFNEFGHHRDYRRAILPVLDMWQEEADVCDEQVPLAGGGFERRYECNGFDTTENDPKAATNAILASCDGWTCERGDGALLFVAGKYREKYLTTLTDDDIVGHQIEYDVLFEDECNRLIPKFCFPDIGYATSDTDFFEDTSAQLISGRVLARDANYQWVQQWRQARRLGKRDWLRLQEKVAGQLNVRLSGINSVYSRWVRLDTPNMLPKLNGKIVENRKSVLSLLQGGFVMDIMRHPENIDAWNPVIEEGAMPSTPPKPDADGIPTPVINLVQARPNGDSVYIRVVIIDPADETLIPVVRYRLADAGSGTPGPWIEQRVPNPVPSGGYIDISTTVVPSGKLFDIQAAFIASDGDYGNWGITANVTSIVDPTAPGSPVNMSAVNASGTVTVSATAANDNTRYLIFKRGTTAQSWAAATVIGQYNVTANQTIAIPNTPGAGTWKYWCGAENGSGIPSGSQASTTITV